MEKTYNINGEEYEECKQGEHSVLISKVNYRRLPVMTIYLRKKKPKMEFPVIINDEDFETTAEIFKSGAVRLSNKDNGSFINIHSILKFADKINELTSAGAFK